MACHAAQLVSTGGLAPRDPHTLAVRWAAGSVDRFLVLRFAFLAWLWQSTYIGNARGAL